MRANYNVNGKIIIAYLFDDMLSKDGFPRKTIEVYRGKSGNTIKKNLHKDENGSFFYWDNEKVYVKNYEYLSAEELVEYVKNARENGDWVNEDTILATLLNESDKLNVVYPLPKIDMVVPFLGISICGTKTQETVCKFTEEKYKKDQWHYKVSLAPVDENMNMSVVSRHPYFSDLCSEIRTGRVELRLAQEKAIA